MFLRLVKNILYQHRQVETLRETLFSHKAFNVSEAFKLFDENQSGSITDEEVVKVFQSNNIDYGDHHRIVN